MHVARISLCLSLCLPVCLSLSLSLSLLAVTGHRVYPAGGFSGLLNAMPFLPLSLSSKILKCQQYRSSTKTNLLDTTENLTICLNVLVVVDNSGITHNNNTRTLAYTHSLTRKHQNSPLLLCLDPFLPFKLLSFMPLIPLSRHGFLSFFNHLECAVSLIQLPDPLHLFLTQQQCIVQRLSEVTLLSIRFFTYDYTATSVTNKWNKSWSC